MFLKTLTYAAMSFCLTAGLASSATFDFMSKDADSASKTYTVDGVTVTVTTGTFKKKNGSEIKLDTRDVKSSKKNGLGSNGAGDKAVIDGRKGNDVIIFTFDQVVAIDTVTFGKLDGKDRFAFGTVDEGKFNRIVTKRKVTETFDIDETFGTLAGTSFAIGALGKRHNFTIETLSVFIPSEDAKAQQSRTSSTASNMPAVPLPAAGMMLLAGLAGMTALRRLTR